MKLTTLVVALVLAGCASVPEIDPASFPTTPAAYKEGDGRWTRANPAEAQPRGEWWKAFGDPALDALVERANAANTSIQQAAARLAQARATARLTDADRWPQLGIGAGASRSDGLPLAPAGAPRTLTRIGRLCTRSISRAAVARLERRGLDARSREARRRARAAGSGRLSKLTLPGALDPERSWCGHWKTYLVHAAPHRATVSRRYVAISTSSARAPRWRRPRPRPSPRPPACEL